MKKLLALLLALLMLLSLAACGKTATDGDNPLAIEQEEPYVEETPPANELDPSSPIPADTGTLALTEQVFEEENLKLMLPEGVTTPDGVTYSADGITATFPARWEVKVGENGFVTFFHSEKMTGGVNFGTVGGGDPAQLVSHWEGEEITKSYGGLNFNGVIMKNESDDQESPPTYTMRLYGPYSGERTLSVFANLRGFQPEDYKAFLDNEQFADVMNSLVIDPNGYHEPGTASENGFTTDRGQIASYTGSDTALEIPARIGQFDTESIGFRVFAGNTAITSVVIPEGVTVIQPNAFEGCSNLESVTFPDTLMEIDANAFRNCPKLKDVTLPCAVAFVGAHAFDSSGAGTFTGAGAEYGAGCFEYSTFDTISIPTGGAFSGDYTFSDSDVAQVNLPEDLESLGQGAFANCRNIDSLTLPSTLRELGKSCFVNMGHLDVNLPEGLEAIPESCFGSTTLDVLVIPESVTSIGDYATYGAACIVIQNPNVEIGTNAIQADYIFLQNAGDYVFPSDHCAMMGSCLYLDGIYDPAEIQGDFYNATSMSYQIYLPSDATMEQSETLDKYLISIGYRDLAWIGSAKDFMPEDTLGFEMQGNNITGYTGESKKLTIPNYVLLTDGTFWYTTNVYGIADEAFKNSDFTAAYFRGQCGNGTGSRILEGNTALTDIWLNTLILFEQDGARYQSDTFAGIPENVTVHLPASMTEEQRSQCEDFLHSIGVPDTAAFDYYSLQ